MYTHCMFCKKPLGSNEVIEPFPVGRRLAFDAAKGRLWVVCRKCERWNLTPLEERWEAVEECEKIFRDTKLRVSTDNIGLARHWEGLTLVRVGKPLRREFAAWRYGDRMAKRRRRAMVTSAIGYGIGVATGAILAAPIPALSVVVAYGAFEGLRAQVRVRPTGQPVVKLRWLDISRARLLPADDEQGVRLRIVRLALLRGSRTITAEGDEARHIAAMIVARLNYSGANRRQVGQAVGRIERAGHPKAFLSEVAHPHTFRRTGKARSLVSMPFSTRLALEMALHEEQERRALEGELWLLERAWKEAEEIAGISDDLLLPEGSEDFVRGRSRRRMGSAGREGRLGARTDSDDQDRGKANQ